MTLMMMQTFDRFSLNFLLALAATPLLALAATATIR